MLTDLRLHKYLQGRLSKREEAEFEILLEKNPALKQRLEELEERGHSVSRPMWERILLDRGNSKGSRVRYTTILPAFLILLLILILASHWFDRPGKNSTFLHEGGNGTAVELLYNSDQGWRYLDAGFQPGDSLTLAIRSDEQYSIRLFGIYAGLPDAVANEIWSSPEGQRIGKKDPKPVFTLPTKKENVSLPKYFALVYDTGSVASLMPDELVNLLRNEADAGRGLNFKYQVFRVPEPDQAP